MRKFLVAVVAFLQVEGVFSVDENANVESMASAFARSDKTHVESMAAISRSLSFPKAVEVLHRHNAMTPALVQVTNMLKGQRQRRAKQPKGYSGVEGAKKLLNDMIYQAMSKYDAEIAKCTSYYAEQCAALEVCRGTISAANYVAANSRALALDAEANINRCQEDIPTRKYELKQHLLKCKAELFRLNTRLKIVMGDIAVMTMILEMTDCDKTLVQMNHVSLLHCIDPCTKKAFISFDHSELQKRVGQLKSSFSQQLMADTFKDLFQGIESMETFSFIQAGSKQMPANINKTQFNNPPVPVTKVPGNPCNDPDAGAPSASDKRSAKCTIGASPQCYKLQERFLLIQSGIQDERDELLDEISMLEAYCEEQKTTYQKQIADDQKLLEESQTKLALAEEKEAHAEEKGRLTAAENERLNKDLAKQMKSCSANYINFETEICALKKIRGELYKMKGAAQSSSFFQDCEVSKWDPEECTKQCAGGDQKLSRSILTHADGGAKCLPLAALRTCNLSPCPVDCILSSWGGWSKCSAECGGGVSQRLREVKMAMKYGGHPCGATSETISCNGQACEKDCELSDWTLWSQCSKDCDGGTQKRMKFIKKEAEGAGHCADAWSVKRLQYKECNMKRCETSSVDSPLTCNRTLDVVLLLDGSGSLGKAGWEAEMKAAHLFVGAFKHAEGKVNMAVILFSGPRTWGGVFKCIGRSASSVALADCGIKTVTHFTSDLNNIDQLVTGLSWPQGSTLTSLALMTAKAEMALGRSDVHSLVIVITDGRPLSYRKTGQAAKAVRKMARLVWVPVTKYAPLHQIKSWATRRWQENVVKVDGFKELQTPAVITHIIADICPKEDPTVKYGRF